MPSKRFPAVVTALLALASARVAANTGVPDGVPVIIHIALLPHEARLAELQRRFGEVSDPSHPEYGQFMSQAEVAALLHPGRARHAAVRRWIADRLGATAMERIFLAPGADLFRINANAGDAAKLGMACTASKRNAAVPLRGEGSVPHKQPPLPAGTSIVTCRLRPTALVDAAMDTHVRHAEAGGVVADGLLDPWNSRQRRTPPSTTLLNIDKIPAVCAGRLQDTDATGTRPSNPKPGCGGGSANPEPYPYSVFPPDPIAVSEGTLTGAGTTAPYVIVYPRCFDQSRGRSMVPVGNADATNQRHWADKLASPCGDGLAIKEITIEFTSTERDGRLLGSPLNPLSLTEPIDSTNVQCRNGTYEVCAYNATASTTPAGGFTSKLYPYSRCTVMLSQLRDAPGFEDQGLERRSWNITATLVTASSVSSANASAGDCACVGLQRLPACCTVKGDTVRHTARLSQFVQSTSGPSVIAAAPGSERVRPIYVSAERTASNMRKWHDVPRDAKVGGAANPQAYGILHMPGDGDGTYVPQDLSDFCNNSGISLTLADSARFLEIPAI